MKTRIIAGAAGLAVLLAVLLLLPLWGTAAAVAVISAAAGFEYLRASGSAKSVRIYIYACACAVLIQGALLLKNGAAWAMGVFLLLVAALVVEAAASFESEQRYQVRDLMAILLAGGIIPIALSCITGLRAMGENGKLYVLLPLIAAFCSDSGAYFAGVYLGKHKATPVSPNKTWEGYAGGVAAGIIAMLLFGAILTLCGVQVKLAAFALYGLMGAVLTELGDLAYSYMKREFGVKDYGNLIPGHGGMMDRFDSMTFAAPAMFVLASVFPAF